MQAVFKALKGGGVWGIISVLIQMAFGGLSISYNLLSAKFVLISAITLPALASALTLRALSPFFAEGLLGGNAIVLAFHIILSINFGVLIGLIFCAFMSFNKFVGGRTGGEWAEIGGFSG